MNEHYKVGDKVVVQDAGWSYDEYDAWYALSHVPKFALDALPVEGEEYEITHMAPHSLGVGHTLYVLNRQFMVDCKAFLPKVTLGMPFFDY